MIHKLPDEHERVLDVVGYEQVRVLNEMSAISGVPVKRLRVILKDLVRLGLVDFGTCYSLDDQTKRCGSGYFRVR